MIAGTDTTATTIAGGLSAVFNKPHTLKKAQNEPDVHVGKNRHVEESDVKNLAYLQAIVKETLRMGPAGTLFPLHVATQDFQISGSHVPAGTRKTARGLARLPDKRVPRASRHARVGERGRAAPGPSHMVVPNAVSA